MAEEAAQFTPELFEDWWTPLQAITYASRCVGLDAASNAIWRLLISGMVDAIAGSTSMTVAGHAPDPEKKVSFIEKRLWRHFQNSGSDLWKGAYAQFHEYTGRFGHSTTYNAFGIRLNPADIRAHLPQPNPIYEAELEARAKVGEPSTAAIPVVPPLEPSPQTNKGGAPRKDWWDDFWIAICGQIYEGDLKPKTQADLEKAMLEWVENHRGSVGETTIKMAARKLFNAWKLGVKN
jgi:hypothetical protein